MERRNLALLCAGVLCFWLFALAVGTAQGAGLRVAIGGTGPAVQADAPAVLAAAPANSGLQLECRAAILMEPETGRVLYEKAPDERMPIASITKLMTLLLTFEAIRGGKLTLDTPVPVSEHAYHMGGSQIWLEPGEQFTLDEMLRAICVSSANDAAVAVAELVGGSEPVFVKQMNARAAELGMTNTTFRNACGLDTEGHLSTARDVAILSRYLLNTCPELLHYTGIWTDSLRNGQTQLVNTNKLLRRYSGITGLKTGTTSGAGVCISASATRDGLTLIAVVLGSPSSADRFHSATTLLDYGFANYAAALYLAYADGDRANCPQDAADLTVTALAGGITELDFGDVTRGALCDAVPAGQRLVLARTTSAAIGALIDTGTVTRTYEESLTAFEPTDGDALVVTDTATLEALEQAGGSYTILRDYGDVFWDIRMNINDVTNNFANPFTLPEAPQRGAGRK